MDHASALAACTALVEQGDPDRFLAAMAAPVRARAPLMVLAAFNLELARAPWISHEPMIARMRLQFWRDVVSDGAIRAHEVAGPLARLIDDAALDRALALAMIDAREVEVGTPAPCADTDALWRMLEGGAGSLLALSVQAVAEGAPLTEAALTAARGLGAAQGLANYLRAVPALVAAGRRPLPDDAPQAIAALARDGLARARAARRALRDLPADARPALLAAWRTEALLRQAAAHPRRVTGADLSQSEFARRGTLLWRSLIGRP